MSAKQTPLWHFWQPRYWFHWLGLGILRLIVCLPQRARMAIGSGLGSLAYRLVGSRRKIALRNIELCFPDLSPAEQQALTRKHFQSLGKMTIEMAMGWWISDDEVERLTTLEGHEHVLAALDKGQGVLMLGGHFAGTEVCGRYMKKRFPPMAAMYRPNNNALMDEFMRRSRAQSVPELITKSGIRNLLRALKNNTPVWYAPDQAYVGKNAVLVDFCGEPGMTNPATSQLLKSSGAVLIPFFPMRLADDSGYHIIYGAPVENIPTDDVEADTALVNRVLEEHIRRVPEQYYWVHKRFKGRPAPYPDPYKD